MKNHLGMMLAASGALATASYAQPLNTVYTNSDNDAVTGSNLFVFGGFSYWTVTPGADSYQNDLYERPTAQNYQITNGRFAAEEYHGYIDIVQTRWGNDSRYFYASLRLFNLNKITNNGVSTIEGLRGRYGVKVSSDPDGRGGVFLQVDEPAFAAGSSVNTVFTNLKTEAWRDADLDVGGRGGPIHGNSGPTGLSVTRTVNNQEEFGLTGFEELFVVSDGRLPGNGPQVLWQRVSPTDPTTIEIAFDYLTAGFTQTQVESWRLFEFQASLGEPSDARGARWNDKFFAIEAGSPNQGIGTDSEFGTQGLGSISFVDTTRTLLACPCVADFDVSGGTPDAADISAFFSAWVVGNATADADCSGGTPDAGDINVFFATWLAGGC
jgi:hypothetical protein